MGRALSATLLAILLLAGFSLFFLGFVLAPLMVLAIGYLIFELDGRRG